MIISQEDKIRSEFKANLPFNYPVIAMFENGKAVMIKSMDLTAKSYKDSEKLNETLDEYLLDLMRFQGQNEPWGGSNVIITADDIKQKELLLVIPENQLDPQTDKILAAFKGKASSMGINLVHRKIRTQENGRTQNGRNILQSAAYSIWFKSLEARSARKTNCEHRSL